MHWRSHGRALLALGLAQVGVALGALEARADDLRVSARDDVLEILGQERTRTNVLIKLQADASWWVVNRNEGGTVNGRASGVALPATPGGVLVRTHDRLEHIRIEGHPDASMGPLRMDVGRPRAAHVVPDFIELYGGSAESLHFGAGAVEVTLSDFEIRSDIRCQGWCHMQLVDGSEVGGNLRIRGAKPFKLRSSTFLLELTASRIGGQLSVRNTELVRMWIRDAVIGAGIKVDGGMSFLDVCDSEVGALDIRNKGPGGVLAGNILVQGNLALPEIGTGSDALLRLESTDVAGGLRLNHRLGSLEVSLDAVSLARKFRVRARGGAAKGLVIRDSHFGERIDVELGDGDDFVVIDAVGPPSNSPRSGLSGELKIHLGLGDDTLMIGHRGSGAPPAMFERVVNFDGGKGTDRLWIDGSARFAQDPKPRGFE